jgi:hypothetical protein
MGGCSLNVETGIGCDSKPLPLPRPIALAHPVYAERIAIVSTLGCSVELPQQSETLVVDLQGPGYSSRRILKAGLDTAEFALACADVAGKSRHGPAGIVSRPAGPPSPGAACSGQNYVTILEIPPGPVSELRFAWAASTGFGRVVRASLLNHEGKTVAAVGEKASAFSDASRWRNRGEVGGRPLYENLRAMPRAWVAAEVIHVPSDDEALKVLRTGIAPDGAKVRSREIGPDHASAADDQGGIRGRRARGCAPMERRYHRA